MGGKRPRVTYDEFDIQQLLPDGWETVTCEPTRRLAVEQKRVYRENQPKYAVRILKRRVYFDSLCQQCGQLETLEELFFLLPPSIATGRTVGRLVCKKCLAALLETSPTLVYR